MSLIKRKPRPLDRDRQEYRDDRLYIIACCDTYAPKQYFESFQLRGVQVHVVPTEEGDSHAEYVLDRLLEVEHEEDDERWLVLDTDHCIQGTHLPRFLTALKRAREHKVQVALSRPCFEFWLLLHLIDEKDPRLVGIANASDAEGLLRQILGTYNKRNLDTAVYPLETVAQAIQRSANLDETVSGGDIPNANTSRVHHIWQSVIRNSTHHQLPEEFRELKDGLKS